MIEVKERKGGFYFYKKNKIITTPNGCILEVKNKNHSLRIIEDFKDQKKKKNPNSILNLTLFACNLNEKEKNLIVDKILETLEYDLVLYRCFNDKKLLDLINKKLNIYVNRFNKKFHTNIKPLNSLLIKYDEENYNFRKFLKKIDKFYLTVLYKSGMLTKSSMLSYFFIKGEIDYKALHKLSNLEYTFQQKMWGKLDEHKIIDENNKKVLKNLSFFLNNLD